MNPRRMQALSAGWLEADLVSGPGQARLFFPFPSGLTGWMKSGIDVSLVFSRLETCLILRLHSWKRPLKTRLQFVPGRLAVRCWSLDGLPTVTLQQRTAASEMQVAVAGDRRQEMTRLVSPDFGRLLRRVQIPGGKSPVIHLWETRSFVLRPGAIAKWDATYSKYNGCSIDLLLRIHGYLRRWLNGGSEIWAVKLGPLVKYLIDQTSRHRSLAMKPQNVRYGAQAMVRPQVTAVRG